MSLTACNLVLDTAGRRLLDVPRIDLRAGQVHALLGPNGAGKSTLMSALAGTDRRLSARVCLHARPLDEWDTVALARHRALLSQEHQVPFDFNVCDIVRMGRYPHVERPHPRESALVDDCLERAGARHLRQRLYERLSGGEKARVQLARVLAQITPRPDDHVPRWLLLDEPTAALDLAHQHAVMRLLRELAAQGTGVLLVLHDLNLAMAYADQVLVMQAGRLDATGPCDEVLQPPLIERVWGVVCERLQRLSQHGRTRSWLALS